MSGKYDKTIWEHRGDMYMHGLFKIAASDAKGTAGKPLVVLIHGGGTNASYYDNRYVGCVFCLLHQLFLTLDRVPQQFSTAGYNVLNINRPGYGDQDHVAPSTKTPLKDAIPLYIELISQVSSPNGIVLIGHSLGAFTALNIAAQAGEKLDIRGVSALGIIPARHHDPALVELVTSNTQERLEIDPSPENIELFMGPTKCLNLTVVQDAAVMVRIFEPGLRSELLEWIDEASYERFVDVLAPGIRVPLQLMAAEYELQWRTLEEGRPILDEVASMFVNAPTIDKHILPGGGHVRTKVSSFSSLYLQSTVLAKIPRKHIQRCSAFLPRSTRCRRGTLLTARYHPSSNLKAAQNFEYSNNAAILHKRRFEWIEKLGQ